jgi:transcriptional regulator of acetoin/glycerol metabolism
VILTESNTIGVSDLPKQIVDGTGAELLYRHEESSANDYAAAPAARPLPTSDFAGEPPGFLLDDVVKKTLMRSLEETEGNRRRAAGLLGVSRSTLYRMLIRYGIADNPQRLSVQHHI